MAMVELAIPISQVSSPARAAWAMAADQRLGLGLVQPASAQRRQLQWFRRIGVSGGLNSPDGVRRPGRMGI